VVGLELVDCLVGARLPELLPGVSQNLRYEMDAATARRLGLLYCHPTVCQMEGQKNGCLMLLKITTVGESVLREQARPLTVAEIRSSEIRQLIRHMRETLNDAPGVGLAAPQVGFPLQLAVIEDKQEYFAGLTGEQIAARERQPVPFHVIINPVLQQQSPADVEFFEGCLSVPGFTAIVPRSRQVRVECLDETGVPRVITASGWYARILQHEVDHLHGTLYLDRMESRTFCSIENHARLWKNKTAAELKAGLG
jgi:peptide deformylase